MEQRRVAQPGMRATAVWKGDVANSRNRRLSLGNGRVSQLRMKDVIRCGVAGVGHHGRHHARIYAELEGAELAGIYDINTGHAEEIASEYGCAVFTSLEELGQACDAVSVVVPTDRHLEVSLPLLQAKCHCLIEKPLCAHIDEAEKMLAAAREAGVIIQVGHVEHYNPVMAFLEKAVDKPRFITADRLAPFQVRGTEVGVVLDLMIHDIGVILQLADAPVKSVESIGVNVLSPTEDIANARITFESGCVANINTSRVSEKKVREIRIFQPSAYLSLDFMNQKGHLLRKQGLSLQKEEIPIERGEPLKIELASFLDCLRTQGDPKVDAGLGKTALDIAIQITEQIRSQQPSFSAEIQISDK